MKAKIFKTVLPLLAFFVAITFAFATQKSSEESSLVQEFRWVGDQCRPVVAGCNNIPSTYCTLAGQIYAKSGTQNCGTMLFHTIIP